MWYETFPSVLLSIFFIGLPGCVLPIYTNFKLGNRYIKDVDNDYMKTWWFRDMHLTGNPYKPNGIDKLPDEPPEQFR